MANAALLERMVIMIEGGERGGEGSENEDGAQSDRLSVSEKLSERLKLAKEEVRVVNEHLGDYLSSRHPSEAVEPVSCSLLVPSGELHYFFEGEYRVGREGELVVCNEDKL